MTTIDRSRLLTLEAYAKIRKSSKPEAIAHRRMRSVALGEHMTLQFEDERTILRQIQEMLHIEKIFDEDGIQGEIDAYAPLVPDGSNWKATMLLEYPDAHERKRELARLIGVEDRMFVEVARKGFYDGTIVHRIVPADRNGQPFVIQGGDPTGTGDGGPGYDLPLEPSRLPHDFGVVSMARNDWPDSAGSQWFVCLSREATARLDGQYCAFGYAVEGADAIVKIAAGEVADLATGRPKSPESVLRASVQPAPALIPGKGRPDARVTRPAPVPVKDESDR